MRIIREKNDIEIDIITGASAGGMTACLLAQNLLYNGDSLTKAYENPLYDAWVKEVDIVKLLDFSFNEDDQKKSLLNIKVVEDIAEKHLLSKIDLEQKSDKNQGKLPKHPAVNSEIQVGITMSNLSGFSYNIKTQNQQDFGYTRYKDQFICSVKKIGDGAGSELREKQLGKDDSSSDSQPTTWSDIRNAGISSGAFPLAFPLRDISRKGLGKFKQRDSDIRRADFPNSIYQGRFLYTDGGVFENEPVGMAKALASGTAVDDISRYYLLIKPGPRETAEDPFLEKIPKYIC
ncbi:patatin-like phospholipase family protein (plasmid) [Acaryochloris sp. 'Moss Beach']|uniref:patatin-like phospholipase family protein n=1 Tax=Acaryochloris sp. 'Moss Beach' TaxID=2740837 RepID=UPI001F484F6B|nr:patatin-like phospholipase family protein [Acaryochloris sp. 'Moss Beach']UJB73125.1 patatin-like phospholipase family protein [Acaryochloris sp. 'Moss Beach']